jgi:hypothetical protein
VWDSELDAEEFFKGIKSLMDKKYAKLTWQETQDSLVGENDANIITIVKKGSAVLVIESEVKDKAISERIVSIFSSPL